MLTLPLAVILKIMKAKNSYIVLLLIILTSCKTIVVNNQIQKMASSPLELGTIGKTEFNLQINNFEIAAIPQFKKKIRVTATLLPFNKSTFKTFTKASVLQGKNSSIKYIDSLQVKPNYVLLKITDIVRLIEELNSEHNTSVINYLKVEPNAKIITTVTMTFDMNTLNEIIQAEEIYLSTVKYKKYSLELYKNNTLVKTIALSNGAVFSYKVSSFCWGENDKKQLEIVKLSDNNSKCTKNTNKSYQQLEKKKFNFKF